MQYNKRYYHHHPKMTPITGSINLETVTSLLCIFSVFSPPPFPVSKQIYATQLSQGKFPRGQAALVQVSQKPLKLNPVV